MIKDIGKKHKVNRSAFHLAGIIPLCGQQYRDRKLPWHPALLPIGEDLLLIDLAIAQAAAAGCETIWLVVDDYLERYFRNRLGDYVVDPSQYGTSMAPDALGDNNRYIPIYYVPENVYDRDRRDSVSFQVIRGISMARKITGQISTYVIPDRYFVTFPYAVFDYEELRSNRRIISKRNEIIWQHKGESIVTGQYMPFTISYKLARSSRAWVWANSTGTKDTSQPREEWQYGQIPTKILPAAQQYSGRWLGPDKVFTPFIETKPDRVELEWFHDVSTFEGYRNFMKSDKYPQGLRENLFSGKTWNSMSFDDNEFEDEEE